MLHLLNSRGTLCSKMGTSPLEGEMGVVEVNTREVDEEGVAGIKVMEVNMTDLEEVMEEVGMVFPALWEGLQEEAILVRYKKEKLGSRGFDQFTCPFSDPMDSI